MKIKNSLGIPKIYYGLHMAPGVAEYKAGDGEAYRILINEDTIKNMGPSFEGRPVFVDHVDEVDLSKVREEADGYVVEAFYNKADGKHWVKFIVVSDEGKKAIQNGFLLSNAYFPKSFTGGGVWQGVDYAKEVTSGEYEHLALVKNPRYESKILTPEEFKQYNGEREVELQKLANSNERNSSMGLNIFKRTKVENAVDFESMVVVLPKSKKEKTISQLVNEMDEMENMLGKPMAADVAHLVKLHDGSECSVGDLVSKHKAMHDELESIKKEKTNATEVEAESDVVTEPAKVEVEGDKQNADEESDKKDEKDGKEKDKEKKQNEADKVKKENFEKLNNAAAKAAAEAQPSVKVELMEDRIARGKSRYGKSS